MSPEDQKRSVLTTDTAGKPVYMITKDAKKADELQSTFDGMADLEAALKQVAELDYGLLDKTGLTEKSGRLDTLLGKITGAMRILANDKSGVMTDQDFRRFGKMSGSPSDLPNLIGNAGAGSRAEIADMITRTRKSANRYLLGAQR